MSEWLELCLGLLPSAFHGLAWVQPEGMAAAFAATSAAIDPPEWPFQMGGYVNSWCFLSHQPVSGGHYWLLSYAGADHANIH